MKIQLIILIILTSFLLVGCSSNIQSNDVNLNENNSPIIIDSNQSNSKTYIDLEIIIVDGKLDPSNIILENNKSYSLTIHNLGEELVRFEIPFYQNKISLDINKKSYEIIKFDALINGLVSIDINGVQLGTIKIE